MHWQRNEFWSSQFAYLRVSAPVLGCDRSKSGFVAGIIAPKLVCLPLTVDITAPKLVCLPTDLRGLHRNLFVCHFWLCLLGAAGFFGRWAMRGG